ncbi:MAG TPA: hypothetical protein VHJ38_09950, partial [Nitrososphaeraceae archaeon]|nr:hypothetical protein [Nitrososphaeraceae archaeon]
ICSYYYNITCKKKKLSALCVNTLVLKVSSMRLIGKTIFQKFGGYYDENGNYIESDIIPSPPVSKSFWCTYGHSWIQT